MVSVFLVKDSVEIVVEEDMSELTEPQLRNLGVYLQQWHKTLTEAIKQYKEAHSVDPRAAEKDTGSIPDAGNRVP